MLIDLSWFGLTCLITLVLLIWKWMGLFLRYHLLRCWDWLCLLNLTEALTLSLLLKLPSRKQRENEFWVFSNSEMNITNRLEKVDEKMGHFSSSLFPSWVMVLKLSKKMHFYNFVLTSARNLGLIKQFMYMHLEGLVTHSQNMALFITLWLTVLEILLSEIEEFC